jgi:predicted nucleotidyltransferase
MGVSTREVLRRLDERVARRSTEDIAAEALAKALLPVFAQALKDAGATRVVLFGSLAGGLFREDSDIDLAVAGLAERTLARLEREFTLRAHRPVELASLDGMPMRLRERVDRLGQELR